MKPIVKYLRELSVVVAGIAVTFSVGAWINHLNQQKDLRLYLSAVRMELEDNLQTTRFLLEWERGEVAYDDYISSHALGEMNADTIRAYEYVYYSFNWAAYKTNAFEMLKGSGLMRLMRDKEQLRDLWALYTSLASVERASNEVLQVKKQEAWKEALALPGEPLQLPPLYWYYVKTQLSYMMLKQYEQEAQYLTAMIERME